MKKLVVELAKPTDCKAIQKFVCDIFSELQISKNRTKIIADRIDLQSVPEYYRLRNGEFWVIRQQKEIIATSGVQQIMYKQQSAGFLRRVFVRQDLRNFGLGSALLKTAETFCRQQKFAFLMFGTSTEVKRANTFYRQNGYEKFTDDIPQELLDDNDDWYFRKRLL